MFGASVPRSSQEVLALIFLAVDGMAIAAHMAVMHFTLGRSDRASSRFDEPEGFFAVWYSCLVSCAEAVTHMTGLLLMSTAFQCKAAFMPRKSKVYPCIF